MICANPSCDRSADPGIAHPMFDDVAWCSSACENQYLFTQDWRERPYQPPASDRPGVAEGDGS